MHIYAWWKHRTKDSLCSVLTTFRFLSVLNLWIFFSP